MGKCSYDPVVPTEFIKLAKALRELMLRMRSIAEATFWRYARP